MRRLEWMGEAVCAQADHTPWFPGKGQGTKSETITAKAICGTCPVRVECRDYAHAIDTDTIPLHGIWGGETARERRESRRTRREAA